MQVEKKNNASEVTYPHLNQDSTGTKVLLYGVTSLGLLYALRRIKPFSRFSKPSDIPDHFLKSKVRLSANVLRVEPSSTNPLLIVETISLLPLPRFGRSKQLPIKIANVDVTANGISWLQIVATGKRIIFIPIVKNRDHVECKISIVQPPEGNLEIGKELVRLGFGRVHALDSIQDLIKDKQALAYRKSLMVAEKWAKCQRNGYWHFAIQPTLWWKLKNVFCQKARALFAAFSRSSGTGRWLY